MVTLSLSGTLRGLIPDGDLRADATTLGGLLDCLEALSPGFRTRVIDEEGLIRRYMNIYVDGHDARYTGGLESDLTGADSIKILSAVAGG